MNKFRNKILYFKLNTSGDDHQRSLAFIPKVFDRIMNNGIFKMLMQTIIDRFQIKLLPESLVIALHLYESLAGHTLEAS